MSTAIKLVANDTKPTVHLTLTDTATGDPIDLSAVTTVVRVYFRAAGTTTLLSTITCVKVDAVNGKADFDFSGGVLTDLEAGAYEGEIEVDFNGAKHTLFEKLKFRVRDEIG
jgi:hypothetical protein